MQATMQQQMKARSSADARSGARANGRKCCVPKAAQTTGVSVGTRIGVVQTGAASLQGTVRRVNEDRFAQNVADINKAQPGSTVGYVGVFDGHGGFAVADWLEKKLQGYIDKAWSPKAAEQSMTDAFLAADRQLLSVKTGFMGMGERGVGGSKCGATAAVAMLYADPADAKQTKLVTANVGDARVVLVRNGQPIQLSVDHVPDDVSERKRIESFNPNPKMPLVRYMGGTWRVGGLLALSRAFGDAYLKGSLQFEGLTEGSDGYSSGFGVIAEPYTTVNTLTEQDTWLIVATDGLFAEEARGGGGGLSNETLTELLQAAGNAPCSKVAETLAKTAVEFGSTDDVTVVVMRLGPA